MAAVDKCYTSNYQDYLAFLSWARGKKFKTPRGCEVKVADYAYYWWSEADFLVDGKPYDRPIFNTPTYVDNYLYHNCPLQFVKDWLTNSYSGQGYCKGIPSEIYDEPQLPQYEPCSKVKVVKKGLGNCPPHKWSWFIEIHRKSDNGFCWYNETNDFWVLPGENDHWTCSAMDSMKSIKSLIRTIIKKWKLPKGYVITARGKYVGDIWVLETR